MKKVVIRGVLVFGLSVLVAASSLGTARAIDVDGFFEGAYGLRTRSDTTEKDAYNIFEGRFQLKGAYSPRAMEEWSSELTFKLDLLGDGYEERVRFKAREAAFSFTPADTVDVKLGRQVLTWGTGDLLFINDLFPKDYVSFFIGRDDEYLKLPSEAGRVSIFADAISFDIVIMPTMEPNNSVTGSRVSFYDGLSGRIVGAEAGREFVSPEKTIENMELAARAYGTVGRYEAAFYLFKGFYKEPRGILDSARKQFFYPRLHVYGASLRGPVLGGIGGFEAGYYDSKEDLDGRDPLIENSSLKYLLGYTRDMGADLSVGLQYMVEHMLDHAAYRSGLGTSEPIRDHLRQLATLRLTKLLKEQTVEAGLFVFYSPTDSDTYLRFSLGYKVSDELKVVVGGNVFAGREDTTEFGQLERNDNLYTRVRYSF